MKKIVAMVMMVMAVGAQAAPTTKVDPALDTAVTCKVVNNIVQAKIKHETKFSFQMPQDMSYIATFWDNRIQRLAAKSKLTDQQVDGLVKSRNDLIVSGLLNHQFTQDMVADKNGECFRIMGEINAGTQI